MANWMDNEVVDLSMDTTTSEEEEEQQLSDMDSETTDHTEDDQDDEVVVVENPNNNNIVLANNHPVPNVARANNHFLLQLHLNVKPVAKPSLKYGGGRGRFFMRRYLDSSVAKKMKEVTKLCADAMTANGLVIVPRTTPVKVKAWMFLRRPDSDFLSKVRGVGRIKPSALLEQNTIVTVKGDADNHAKFLLDALTGAVYQDDAQVVELIIYKLRDSVGLCNGRMSIECTTQHTHLEDIMPNF